LKKIAEGPAEHPNGLVSAQVFSESVDIAITPVYNFRH